MAQNLTPQIYNLFTHIQTRGRDSYGLLAVNEDSTWRLIRGLGRVPEKLKDVMGEIKTTTLIQHTRAATNGEVSIQNAHPFVNEDRTIGLVHNGIITQSDTLRTRLEKDGHIFSSKTDSEAILHLFESHWDRRTTIESIKEAWKACTKSVSNSVSILLLLPNDYIMGFCAPSLAMLDEDGFIVFASTSPFNPGKHKWDTLKYGEIVIARRGTLLLREKVVTGYYYEYNYPQNHGWYGLQNRVQANIDDTSAITTTNTSKRIECPGPGQLLCQAHSVKRSKAIFCPMCQIHYCPSHYAKHSCRRKGYEDWNN